MIWSRFLAVKISTDRTGSTSEPPRRSASTGGFRLALRARSRRALRAGSLGLVLLASIVPALAAPGDPPYDEQYMRLATILGGLHHLRPLCGANEPQVWRDKMNALIAAENPSAERRKRLIDEFNRSYRSFAEIYRDCTPAAQAIIDRYLSEGARISEDVLTRYGRR